MKIRQQLVKDTPYKFGRSNKRTHITIHETGNPRAGANAAAHANLQSGGNHTAQAAWHWQVDDREAVQSYTHDFQLWHAGDGYGDGNLHSIGIEVCVNSDGDYAKARRNTAELVRQILLDEPTATVSRVVQHNHWSGKNCPAGMRANGGRLWNELQSNIKNGGGSVPKPPTPSPNITADQAAREIVYGRNGRGNPWGNGQARINALRQAGLDPNSVQRRVNEILAGASSPKISEEVAAREIVYGRNGRGNPWGNGQARINALRQAGLDPNSVQRRVNQLLGY